MARYGNIQIIPAQTPAIDATPDYAAGDSLFTTPLEMKLNGSLGGKGVVQSVTITDKANQKPTLTILFFKAAPSGGTYTKNGQIALSAADRTNLLGKIDIASTDWTTLATGVEAVATAYGPLPVRGATSSAGGVTQHTVYFLVVVQSAYNAAAADDLTFAFGILCD